MHGPTPAAPHLAVIALAQLGFPLNPPAPPPLPPPPVVGRLLFEQPAWLIGGLVAIGTIAFLAMRAAGRRRGAAGAGCASIALAAGVWLNSTIVRTAREQVAEATWSLIDAATRCDAPGVERMLTPECELMDAARSPLGRAVIVRYVSSELAGQYRVRGWTISESQHAPDPAGGLTTQALVVVRSDVFDVPYASWWRISWRRAGDGWKASRIEALNLPAGTLR